MLSIKNVSKTYKKSTVKAIDDISIDIEDGDIYGFIGPNGAGKSTTIKCVVGIHGYDSGEIYLEGKTLKEDSIAYKKMIAYVPDNPDIYEHLTGIQYLDFIANVFGMGEEKNELIHKYASIFGIEKDLANPVKTYSHGMKQKLQIISALIHSPKLLVLDEPFVGLDPKATFQIKEIMREEAQKGVSFFFSSHVLEVVEKLCNKIAIIKNGEIIKQGIVDEIKGEGSLEDEFMEIMK